MNLDCNLQTVEAKAKPELRQRLTSAAAQSKQHVDLVH